MVGWEGFVLGTREGKGRYLNMGLDFTGNFNGDFSIIKHFNGGYRLGSLFHGEGRGNFSIILFTSKKNGLAKMTKRRTFLSFCYTLFKSDYISPSSPASNKTLLQLLIIPLFLIFKFCSKWLKRTAPIKYVDIKYKYLFLKSKKIKSKKKSLNLIPILIFMLKIIALYNMDSTRPNRFLSPDPCPNEHFQSLRFVQNEINYCKIKEEYYIAYALSNLTFRNQNSSFKHLLLLCGDVVSK